MAPDELIAATAGSKWRINILEAWTDAAGRFKERAWAAPLWRCWLDLSPKEMKQSHADRSGTLRNRGRRCSRPPIWSDSRWRRLPTPRSTTISRSTRSSICCPSRGARRSPTPGSRVCLSFIGGITAQTKLAEPWDDTLETAALALPETHFTNKVEPLDIPDSKHWQINYFRTQLEQWQTTVSLRRRIAKELPL